jgi:hypothetical protein
MGLDITTIVGVGAIGYGVYYAYTTDCKVKSDGTRLNFMEWVNVVMGYDTTVYATSSITSADGVTTCSGA